MAGQHAGTGAEVGPIPPAWRITARMPGYDRNGLEGYFAISEEQYGIVYLLEPGDPAIPGALPVLPVELGPPRMLTHG